jgi:anti-sigma factor RsiW
MECKEFRERVTAFVDGEAADKRSVLESHAAACRDCRLELRWAKALKAASAGRARAQAPAGLKESLKSELRRQQASGRPLEGPSFLEAWRMSWRLSMAGLATAGALAAGTLVLVQYRAGLEEIPLDDLLDAHRRYALTMPAADAEAIYAGMSEDLSDDL